MLDDICGSSVIQNPHIAQPICLQTHMLYNIHVFKHRPSALTMTSQPLPEKTSDHPVEQAKRTEHRRLASSKESLLFQTIESRFRFTGLIRPKSRHLTKVSCLRWETRFEVLMPISLIFFFELRNGFTSS